MKIVRKEIISDDRNYWDITIPDNHNFVLENGSVVHNCGSGVGFSVERQYVNQLPEVPEKMFDSDTTIVVKDSKEGWAKALRQLIALLYSGEIPKWDTSQVRPAGSPLKTFGGRASGPGPLEDLFRFVCNVFRNAKGRKLTSLECHDIMCKIGEVVVVGGVRRSAMISLSNLSDDRMRHAKSGAWWEANVQRALSNNSAVYTERPDIGIFLQEWLALYESKSGERGIFNRAASKNIIKANGRRNPDHEWGTNPSLAKGTKVFTTEGIFSIEELEGRDFFVNTLDKSVAPAKCFLSSPSAKLYEIVLPGNISYFATAQHKWPVVRSGKELRLQTTELKPGDYIPSNHKKDVLPFGTLGSYDDGFMIGWNLCDGWINAKTNGAPEVNLSGETLNKLFEEHGVSHKSNGLPLSVWKEASEEFRKGLVDGLISSDGHVNTGGGIDFVSVHEKLVDDLASLLGCYGIKVSKKIRKISEADIIIKGKTVKNVRQSYSIHVKDIESKKHFSNIFKLSRNDKQTRLNINKNLTHKHTNIQSSHWKIKDILETNRTEPVWDITVNHEDHSFELDHCQTGNCSEIILRPNQMCNLSEVVVRARDTGDDLKRKVRLATVLGTLQSTFTHFPYLRKIWKKNVEEERLLGVSLTGIYDHHILNNYKDNNLGPFLAELKQIAIDTNNQLAKDIGIEPSVAVTAVKPSGTVSQLVDSASGIHPRHDNYYIRRVRSDNKDPLTQFLKEAGIPFEPDVTNPDFTTVFSFPKKAPDGAITRESISAIDHLKLWLVYQKYWCEHKPSVTVNIREDEWFDVGAWVWRNFDSISGISFLPYDGGSYRQAPYETVTKEKYEEMLEKMPTHIDWDSLQETVDETEGTQILACGSGNCEV